MKGHLPLVLLGVAVAALGSATYLASFCVLLENECHLQHGDACARLEQYLAAAKLMALLAISAGLGATATYVHANRMSGSTPNR